jgi:hypothetical protein
VLTPNAHCGNNSRCDGNEVVTCEYGIENPARYDCGSAGCTQRNGVATCSNEVDCVGGTPIAGLPNALAPVELGCGAPHVCGPFVPWTPVSALDPAKGGSIADGRYTLQQAIIPSSSTLPPAPRVRSALSIADGRLALFTDNDGSTLDRSGPYEPPSGTELHLNVNCEHPWVTANVIPFSYGYTATSGTLTLYDHETGLVYVYARVE